MWPKNKVIRFLQESIYQAQAQDKLESPCTKKHDLASPPEADSCPCRAELYWQQDRLDESLYRLITQKHSVARWWRWYLWSSTTNPRFPRQSIEWWSQTDQPIAAWQKYGVAQKNGDVYIYYKHGREHKLRPAAGPHL